jgi:DNA polymerase III subunit delta
MAVNYFYGTDTYGAREAIGELAKKENSVIKFAGREELEQEGVAGVLAGVGEGLFGRMLLVVLEPAALPVVLQEEIGENLKNRTAGAIVFWDRLGGGQVKNKKWLTVQVVTRQFMTWPVAQLVQWLLVQARKRGGEIETEVARLLIQRVGGDRWRLQNELERLLLGGAVTKERIAAELPAKAETEIFRVLDELGQGNIGVAVTGMENLLDQGEKEIYLLTMMAYQLRTLLVARLGRDEGKNAAATAQAAGMKTYPVEKSWTAAQRKTMVYWREALARVAATDLAVKQGRVDPRTGLMMLAVKLGEGA